MTGEGSIEQVLAGDARWCVVNADCLDVLPTLPERSVDHVITDPPYEGEAHQKSRRSRRGHGPNFVVFPIDFAQMTEDARDKCGAEYTRICRRWCLIFCQIEGVPRWRKSCAGLVHKRTAVWVKPDSAPQFTGDRPASGVEYIEMLHTPGRSRWNSGGKRGVYTHNCNSQLRNPDEDHQTPKPEPLMQELVCDFTDPGELILDSHCGSGTTGVAALRLGRRFIGIEREPKWAELSRERIRAEESGSTLQARRAGQRGLFEGTGT